MILWGWGVLLLTMQAVLKFVLKERGLQFVIRAGVFQIPKLSVEIWDTLLMVWKLTLHWQNLYRYAFVLGAIPIDNCYNEGQLSFGITDINCTGSEDHLVNCSHSNAVLYNCDTYDDAGVQCQSELVII